MRELVHDATLVFGDELIVDIGPSLWDERDASGPADLSDRRRRGHASDAAPASSPGAALPTILYGAAYYNEYMPADLQPDRLEKDVAVMTQAGITVVRMGESTWSLWEPEDGKFEYAWMDRVVGRWAKQE